MLPVVCYVQCMNALRRSHLRDKLTRTQRAMTAGAFDHRPVGRMRLFMA